MVASVPRTLSKLLVQARLSGRSKQLQSAAIMAKMTVLWQERHSRRLVTLLVFVKQLVDCQSSLTKTPIPYSLALGNIDCRFRPSSGPRVVDGPFKLDQRSAWLFTSHFSESSLDNTFEATSVVLDVVQVNGPYRYQNQRDPQVQSMRSREIVLASSTRLPSESKVGLGPLLAPSRILRALSPRGEAPVLLETALSTVCTATPKARAAARIAIL